jgi:hypothetical protein
MEKFLDCQGKINYNKTSYGHLLLRKDCFEYGKGI